MPVTSIAELFAALGRGATSEIVGTPEAQWIDFKSQIYRLTEDYQKLELAKDVTALANTGGGVIVVGFATERRAETGQELATEIRRVPMEQVNFQQYSDVPADWTFPAVLVPEFRWWAVGEENGTNKGVLTIYVSAVDQISMPVLVKRAADEGTRRGILVGVFRRYGDRVPPPSAEQLHAQIQLGSLVQRGILPTAPTSSDQGMSEQHRAARLASDNATAGLEGTRRYFLQAWPGAAAAVDRIHATDPTGMRYLMRNPPELRVGGFSLNPGAEPELIEAGGLRSIVNGEQTLSLQRNGLLTFTISAGSEGLAWGSNRRGRGSAINSLALVEYTLEFVRFFALQVLPHCQPPPAFWWLRGGMADLHDDSPTVLSGGQPGHMLASRNLRQTAEPSFAFGPLQVDATASPATIAFQALTEVYSHFGIDAAEIPYSQNRTVDEQAIRDVR